MCLNGDVEELKFARFCCGEFMGEWNIGVDVVEVARFKRSDYPNFKRFFGFPPYAF